MLERFERLISRGMDVWTADNHRIGTVERVFLPASLQAPERQVVPPSKPLRRKHPEMELGGGYVKVDVLGEGPDLYVPFGAIDQVTPEGITLMVDREEIPQLHWEERPRGLKE